LFRDEVEEAGGVPGSAILVVLAVVLLALVGFAVWVTESALLAAGFIAGVLAIMVLFWGIGHGVTWVARRVPRPRRPELALAITGVGAPGGLTRSVVLSLGAGLSLLVAVALVDNSLVEELKTRLPENAPDYFALDVAKQDEAAFRDAIEAAAPGAHIEMAPMLRGRIVRLKGVPAEEAKIEPEARWVLRGDRGITYSRQVPKGSKVVAGAWWPADVTGEPQVSFVADLAREMNLGLGDTITVNIFGRNVTARITSLRTVEWESLSINFTMIFSPNTLEGAPHNLVATVTFADGTPGEARGAAVRQIGQLRPGVTMINVDEAIAAFGGMFARVMVAVRVAAAITLLAGALVLAGALATAQRRRMLQAVILKAIGATRARLLVAHLAEYGLLAFITSAVALGVGTLAAWIVCAEVLELELSFSLAAIAGAVTVCVALVLGFGLAGTWRVLAAKPVPILRGL
jgi:putative ABC transport system permease protein